MHNNIPPPERTQFQCIFRGHIFLSLGCCIDGGKKYDKNNKTQILLEKTNTPSTLHYFRRASEKKYIFLGLNSFSVLPPPLVCVYMRGIRTFGGFTFIFDEDVATGRAASRWKRVEALSLVPSRPLSASRAAEVSKDW